MLDLTGKVALITGIGCVGEGWGNGTTIATLFSRQGAAIFGCDISLAAAERAASQIRAESSTREVTVIHGDATSSISASKVVEACMEKHGRIDILVNNVGKSEPGDPARMTEEIWDQQIDVNLKSVYLFCHLVLPIMEKQPTGGSVVNISSVAGLRYIGKPQAAYSAAKAAIIGFTVCTFRSNSFLLSVILGVQIFFPEASNELAPASGMGNADSEMSIEDHGCDVCEEGREA